MTVEQRYLVECDPRDRSINQPAILMSESAIVRLYNQYHKEAEYELELPVTEWFIKFMKNLGWHTVEFIGAKQALLVANCILATKEV